MVEEKRDDLHKEIEKDHEEVQALLGKIEGLTEAFQSGSDLPELKRSFEKMLVDLRNLSGLLARPAGADPIGRC